MAATTKKNILQRINEVQHKATYVQKEKKQGMRYSIVSHDDVTAKLRPLMVEAGIVYWPNSIEVEQVGNRTQVRMVVCFASIDDPEDNIHVHSLGYGIDEQDKGPGKAISYAVKYALLKAFGLETGDDPDKDQEAQFKDPNNPHNEAISAFQLDIEQSTDLERLMLVAEQHKDAMMAAAVAGFEAKVQSVRQKWAAKKKLIEGATK